MSHSIFGLLYTTLTSVARGNLFSYFPFYHFLIQPSIIDLNKLKWIDKNDNVCWNTIQKVQAFQSLVLQVAKALSIYFNYHASRMDRFHKFMLFQLCMFIFFSQNDNITFTVIKKQILSCIFLMNINKTKCKVVFLLLIINKNKMHILNNILFHIF